MIKLKIICQQNLKEIGAKIVNKIVLMEMYWHAPRADSAELATEKTCRPATTQKGFGGGLEGVTE